MKELNIPNLEKAKYIVAVSGGLDSMVLLDNLNRSGLDIIVAHVNHGIRSDSEEDLKVVRDYCQKYNLKLESVKLELGENVSEERAREKRYEYLYNLQKQMAAKAIITGHHKDDIIETAFINLIRGTGIRGLSSLKSSDALIRPQLHYSKDQLLRYAKEHGLRWREDYTNNDKSYLRNKIRLDVVSKMTTTQKEALLKLIEQSNKISERLDKELNLFLRRGLHKGSPVISRKWFNNLPHDISKEVVRKLLVDTGAQDIDKKTIERVTVAIKTLSHGKTIQAPGVNITLTKRSARLKSNSKTDKIRV